MLDLVRVDQSDKVKALHDAPADCVAFVLWGGYTEQRYAYVPIEGIPLPPVTERKRGLFSFAFYKAEVAMRVQLFQRRDGSERSTLILFFRGKERRNAGFWTARDGDLGHQSFETVRERQDGGTEGITIKTSYLGTLAHWVATYFYRTGGDAA